jgi:tetratricopeptide (TPR) repeat protein
MSSVKNKFLELIGVTPLTPEQKLDIARADFQKKSDTVLASILFLEAAGADVSTLKKLLADAEALTKPEPGTVSGFEAGLKGLSTHKKVAKKIEKALESSGKGDQKQQLYMNKYLNKKERLTTEIANLKDQPGTSGAIAELQGMIKAAERIAKGKTPNYVEAYNAMSGFSKKRKQAQSEAAGAIQKLPDDGEKAPKDGSEPLTLRTTFNDTEKALIAYWDLVADSVAQKEQDEAYKILDEAITVDPIV